MIFTRQKVSLTAIVMSFLFLTPSYADVFSGYNTDGTAKYSPEPPGASGPIATPENPSWISNPDGTKTEAEKNYTFLPNAEERAKNNTGAESDLNAAAPAGMMQVGFNPDGSPKFGSAPQGATGPIATPENPFWIKNPDGTQTAAEKSYIFLPNAEERAKNASFSELKTIIEEEISKTKFNKVKKSGSFVLTSTIEMSAASPLIKVIATKKGAKRQNIPFAYSEDGELVIKASGKLKGYQVQILSETEVLKKITL